MKKITAFGEIALPVLSSEHNRVHAGEMYTAYLSDAILGASATLLMEIRIPDGIELHLKTINFYTGSDGELELIEAPTIGIVGTTPLEPMNRNRNKQYKKAHVSIFSDPATISAGTLLEDMHVAGGAQTAGGERGTDLEWELQEDTIYIVRLTNQSGQAQQCDLRIEFYEEVD